MTTLPLGPLAKTEIFAGQDMDGGRVSTTVMVCVQFVELPQRSVAVQVRVIMIGEIPLTVSL